MDAVQKLIQDLMERGILIEPSAFDFIKQHNIPPDKIYSLKIEEGVLTRKHLEPLIGDVGCEEITSENNDTRNTSNLITFVEIVRKKKRTIAEECDFSVEVENKETNNGEISQKGAEIFVEMFKDRYERLRDLLLHRAELRNAISIGRLKDARNLEGEITVIGLVRTKSKTKSGNYILELEDPTGVVSVFVREEASKLAGYVVEDEVIGVRGTFNGNFLYASNIVFPGIPIPTGVNKVEDPVAAVFISDLHYGSKQFMVDIERRFLGWINDKNDELASKVKYIFIAGDLVDGIGIYPEQEADLLIKDIYKQYELLERFIERIPEHIAVVLCPGNHDAVRSAEPQPPIPKDFVPNLYSMDNVFLATNPAYVRIHAMDGEVGVLVLMYHGYSFTSMIDAMTPIRKHGTTHPQYVMREILKKRHLAPTYGCVIQAPYPKDQLVIDKVPDIFHTGDLHSHGVDNYKGVTLISSSTFQGQTAFMDRVGHVANPGKVTVVELNTRNVKVLDFCGE